MTSERVEEYIAKLRKIEADLGHDPEVAHAEVDDLMIEIIRWYAPEVAKTIEELDITWWYA